MNCVKPTPKWTSSLPFASQKRKWVYISRDYRLSPIFLLHKCIFCFPLNNIFQWKMLENCLCAHHVLKVGRNCSSARETSSFVRSSYISASPPQIFPKGRAEDIYLRPRARRDWAQELPKTGTHLQTGQSRLYSREWGALGVHAAHVGLRFQLNL